MTLCRRCALKSSRPAPGRRYLVKSANDRIIRTGIGRSKPRNVTVSSWKFSAGISPRRMTESLSQCLAREHFRHVLQPRGNGQSVAERGHGRAIAKPDLTRNGAAAVHADAKTKRAAQIVT